MRTPPVLAPIPVTAFLTNPRLWAAGILVAGYAVTLAVNWPGHLEFDSIRQLLEGRRGLYSNWHPPIMSWMLGAFDAIVPGGALFVLFDATLAFGALLSLLWLVERPSWWAVPAALVAVALPQLFLFQAIVWKDVLFADALFAGFVALAHAAYRWRSPVARRWWLAAAVLILALAILSRQNGLIVLPCAVLALTIAVMRNSSWRNGIVAGAAFLFACGGLAFATNAALQVRAARVYAPIIQLEDLQLYDIGGMLKRDPAIRLDILDKERPALAEVLRTDGPRLYTPIGHDRLTDDPAIRRWILSSPEPVNRQWRALVLSHLGTWLAVRAQDFGWVFLSQHTRECLTYAVGVITIPADLKAAKLSRRYDARDTWLNDNYGRPLLGSPVFSHPVFAAIGMIAFILLLWRRRPADIVMAGLLLAAFLFTLSFFVISIACQYRYLYALDVAAIGAAFYLLADFRLLESSSVRRSQETAAPPFQRS
jgi:hypothetical protein